MDITQDLSLLQMISAPYIKRLSKIESQYLRSMKVEQYTIDILQNTPIRLRREFENGQLIPDTPGSLCYRLDTLLEVMNPELVEDVAAIKDMHKVAEEWRGEVEKYMKADE